MKDESVISQFDRMVGALEGLPDVTHSRPSTVCTTVPLIGAQQSWIVRTARHRDKGDYIFVEMMSQEGMLRVFLPPEVTAAIHRQSDALTAKIRSKVGKATAKARKERGEPLPFLKKKKS